jgi:hypothetical protein
MSLSSQIPPAATIIQYTIGLSSSYLSLHEQLHGSIDARFHEPANSILSTCGRSFMMNQPVISSRSFDPIRLSSIPELAQYISEHAPGYRQLWSDRLERDSELQVILWNNIQQAATYETEVDRSGWAADVIKMSLALSLPS